MKKYAVYRDDNGNVIFGLVYDFRSKDDCEVTVFNSKYPGGRKVSDSEHVTCMKYIIESSSNIDFISEDEFDGIVWK